MKLEMTFYVIRICWLDETVSKPVQWLYLFVELEVPTIQPHTLIRTNVVCGLIVGTSNFTYNYGSWINLGIVSPTPFTPIDVVYHLELHIAIAFLPT